MDDMLPNRTIKIKLFVLHEMLLRFIRSPMTSVICIFFLGWQIQDLFLMNSDVSWLIHCSALLMKGGSYSGNFLETNPPLILYLYMPIHYLKEHFQIPTVFALRLYIFFIAALSLFLSSNYLKHYFNNIFIINLAIIFLILPLSDFGQREHLTIILIMPYLLSLPAQFKANKLNSKWQTSLVCCLATIGFSLKPYNLGILAAIEMYYCYRKKSFLAAFRLENLIILCGLCVYIGSILAFHSDYIDTILPLITPIYYSLYTVNINALLSLPFSIFTYFICIFYLIQKRSHSSEFLEDILLIAMLGFWIIFIFQRTNWYYHELPALSLSILLASRLFTALLGQKSISRSQYTWLVLLVAAMGLYFGIKTSYIYANIKFFYYLAGFFSLFTYVYWVVIFKSHRNAFMASWYTAMIMIAAFCFYHYLGLTIWHQHAALLTTLLLSLMFAYAAPHQNMAILSKWLFMALLGILLFTYPFYRLAYVANSSNYYQHLYQQLIARTTPYQDQSTYYFTNTSEIVFPLVDYSSQNYTSRFWSFVWLPILKKPSDFDSYPSFYLKNKQLLDYYIGDVITDFMEYSPQYVFVDDRVNSTQFFYGAAAPDFIKLFSQNKQFASIWQAYQLIETIDLPPLCRYKVYGTSQ